MVKYHNTAIALHTKLGDGAGPVVMALWGCSQLAPSPKSEWWVANATWKLLCKLGKLGFVVKAIIKAIYEKKSINKR